MLTRSVVRTSVECTFVEISAGSPTRISTWNHYIFFTVSLARYVSIFSYLCIHSTHCSVPGWTQGKYMQHVLPPCSSYSTMHYTTGNCGSARCRRRQHQLVADIIPLRLVSLANILELCMSQSCRWVFLVFRPGIPLMVLIQRYLVFLGKKRYLTRQQLNK
jgi:hypothetical protein